jgi:hypothetical protein
MCESRRSSKTEREDERDSERERVYRARREDKEGEGGKVDNSGGRPSRIRLPRICVCLRVVQHRPRQRGGAQSHSRCRVHDEVHFFHFILA